MLAAARRQAAAAPPVGTAGSIAVEDAARDSVSAAANGVAEREAADTKDAGRPTKRARTATPAQNVMLPPQHSTAHAISHSQQATSAAEGNTERSAGRVAAGSWQALAAEQLDGNGCHGADADAEWPPDMHDTVGCVVIDADGARRAASLLASQSSSWDPALRGLGRSRPYDLLNA